MNGYVEADFASNMRARGISQDRIDADLKSLHRPRFMKPCPECAAKEFLKNYAAGRNMTWRTWNHRKELIEAVGELQAWQPTRKDPCLLIYGGDSPGNCHNGKTHALMAQGLELASSGRRVRYQNAADVVHRSKFEQSPDDQLIEYVGLLLIDDLGSETDTPASRELVDRVLDGRHRYLRPTIVATRLALFSISKRYPRFASRIYGSTQIEWVAEPFE